MGVLVSARTELFFHLVVSGVVLCFFFGRKTNLITHEGFSCSWAVAVQSQGCFNFPYCPTSEGAEGEKELGGGSWPKLDKGIFPTIWHYGKKLYSRGEQSLLGDCLGICWWVVCNCIVHHLFHKYISLPYFSSFSTLENSSQSTCSTLPFFLPSSLPHSTGSVEWVTVWCWDAAGLNHNDRKTRGLPNRSLWIVRPNTDHSYCL